MAPVLAETARVLEAGLAEGVAPALAAVVLRDGLPVHRSWHGALDQPPRPVGPEVLFDLASLTKVLATTTLTAQAVAEGGLALDAPVARWLPGFEAAGKGQVTVRQLLAHSSGLPAWRPWHRLASAGGAGAAASWPVSGAVGTAPREAAPEPAEEAAGRRARVVGALLAEPVEAPPGSRAVYSDPGFMALGLALEAALGARLSTLFEARVARPLGLESTFFVDALDPVATAARVAGRAFAPTGPSEARGQVSRGTVDDDVAWAMGGAAGHAGLFSTADEVGRIGQAWLDALADGGSLVPPEAAAAFARLDATPGSARALGWDTPSGPATTLGSRLGRGPRGALGHLGYTGCSLWLDLDAGLVAVLLSNHVHPAGPDRAKLLAFRRRFHDAVAEGCWGIGTPHAAR
jgi:CubicO group peptidase (beta-lactamase class C family)